MAVINLANVIAIMEKTVKRKEIMQMADIMDPFKWTPTFSDFKKNIITDDIIPDDLLEGIKEKIKTHCLSNYQNYKPSANVGYSRSCNDTGGSSNCNCDISGVNCYPASENGGGCDGIFTEEAGGGSGCHDSNLICNGN